MSLATTMASLFPKYASYPDTCWVRRCVERAYDGQSLGEAVRISHSLDVQGLTSRLHLEHPPGRVHHDGHDQRLLDAFTECEAMAWAAEAGFQKLHFNLGVEQAADLVGLGVCIEAKTLNNSVDDQAAWDAAHTVAKASGTLAFRSGSGINDTSGLIHKMDSALSNAQAKWAKHQPSDQRVVFFCLAQTDLGTLHDDLWEEIEDWAIGQSGGEALVVVDNHQWRTPRITTRV